MKSLSFILLSILLAVSAFVVTGCAGQGQTADELRRERIRTRSADTQGMYEDLEAVIMVDRPSRMSEIKVR